MQRPVVRVLEVMRIHAVGELGAGYHGPMSLIMAIRALEQVFVGGTRAFLARM